MQQKQLQLSTTLLVFEISLPKELLTVVFDYHAAFGGGN